MFFRFSISTKRCHLVLRTPFPPSLGKDLAVWRQFRHPYDFIFSRSIVSVPPPPDYQFTLKNFTLWILGETDLRNFSHSPHLSGPTIIKLFLCCNTCCSQCIGFPEQQARRTCQSVTMVGQWGLNQECGTLQTQVLPLLITSYVISLACFFIYQIFRKTISQVSV